MATGSTATRDLCVFCGREVAKSISRRRVGGTSSKLVLPVFVELHEKVFPGKTFLPDFSENSRLFWCRPCFAKLEKLLKLRKDTQEVENQIIGNIQSVGTLFVHNPTPLTPKKRGVSSPHTSGPSPKRRRHFDTPERQVLSRTVVTGSPSVSVSLCFLLCMFSFNRSCLPQLLQVLLKRKKGSSRIYALSRSLKRLGKSVGMSKRLNCPASHEGQAHMLKGCRNHGY